MVEPSLKGVRASAPLTIGGQNNQKKEFKIDQFIEGHFAANTPEQAQQDEMNVERRRNQKAGKYNLSY